MHTILDILTICLIVIAFLCVLVIIETVALIMYRIFPAVRKRADKFFDSLPDWEE